MIAETTRDEIRGSNHRKRATRSEAQHTKHPWLNHHELFNVWIQCTINFSLNLGLRIGSSLAFSFSSIGSNCIEPRKSGHFTPRTVRALTTAIQKLNVPGSSGIAP